MKLCITALQVNELSTALKSEQNRKSHFQSAFEQMKSRNDKLDADLREMENNLKRVQVVNAVS